MGLYSAESWSARTLGSTPVEDEEAGIITMLQIHDLWIFFGL